MVELEPGEFKSADGKVIPSPIRRIETLTSVDRSNALLLTGRLSGNISFHRLPASNYDSTLSLDKVVELALHTGPVSAVLFIEEGARLVTAGAEDGMIQVRNQFLLPYQ